MASVQELQDNVNELSGKIDGLKTRVAEDVQALRDQIAQQGLDQAQLDAINAQVDQLEATVDAVDPDPSNPPAEPTDETPDEPQP